MGDNDDIHSKSNVLKARKMIAEKFKQSYNDRVKHEVGGVKGGGGGEQQKIYEDDAMDIDVDYGGDLSNDDIVTNINVNQTELEIINNDDDEDDVERKKLRLQRKRHQYAPSGQQQHEQQLDQPKRVDRNNSIKSSIITATLPLITPPPINFRNVRNPNELCNRLKYLSALSRRTVNNEHYKREIDSILLELSKRNIIL